VTTAENDHTAPQHRITIDLHVGDHFVLSDALREWGSRQQFEAGDEPHEPTREQRLKWASAAESLSERVETALDLPAGNDTPAIGA
jgi:hypothetical protein